MDLKRYESDFPRRLRTLRKSSNMTQKEVSTRLEVGQSAVANYEQGLRFPDEKTLKSLSALFDVSIDFLLGNNSGNISSPDRVPGPDVQDLPGIYRELLIHHRPDEALELLIHALAGGRSLEYLLAHVLIPTLKTTGDLWEKGIIDIAEEHAISEEVERAAGILSYLNPGADSLKAACVCASAGPEMHSLGTRMVSYLLAAEGWDSVFLGIHTPILDILKLCEAVHADLLVLSATLDSHIDSVGSIIRAVRSEPGLKGCGTLVGGGAFVRNPRAWRNVGADLFARDIPEAVRRAGQFLKNKRSSTS